MDVELNSMSLKELKELQAQVTRAVSSYEDRKRKDALADAEEAVRKHGYSLNDLTGTATTRKRSNAVPKYANPADRSDTWSGRGRKPRWMEEALRQGKSPEDLAI